MYCAHKLQNLRIQRRQLRTMRFTRSVHFPAQEVTSISRLPNRRELSRLNELEDHMECCRTCMGRWRPHNLRRSLCGNGRYLATLLLDLIVGSPDGKIYGSNSNKTHYERIEVPRCYYYVHKLFVNRQHMAGGCRQRPCLKKADVRRRSQREADATGPAYTVVFRNTRRVR